jgi:hypothetical protein
MEELVEFIFNQATSIMELKEMGKDLIAENENLKASLTVYIEQATEAISKLDAVKYIVVTEEVPTPWRTGEQWLSSEIDKLNEIADANVVEGDTNE